MLLAGKPLLGLRGFCHKRFYLSEYSPVFAIDTGAAA
jgi:hypothetical protein